MLTFTKDDIQNNKLYNVFTNKQHVCNAPFVSLNFDSSGVMSACCMSRLFILGRYPDVSIMDVWAGEKLKEMREAIDRFDFSKGCYNCHKQIIAGNYNNTQLAAFDNISYINASNIMPKVMEFEMSSTCNYECIMCGGKWSSSIRKNREKLPPLATPYNDTFIDELRPFLPYLVQVRFLGGEPFATPLYYKIWDELYRHNPNTHIYITTNGSIFNSKVQDIIERHKNIQICISIDSINKETYKFIRRNGDLDTVFNTIAKIQSIERNKKTKIFVGVAVCPMIQNWKEIPDILNYCAENELVIAFNNVTGVLGGRINGIHENGKTKRTFDNISNPNTTAEYETLLPEVSLNTLSKEEIQEIIKFYKSIEVKHTINRERFNGLILSLESLIK